MTYDLSHNGDVATKILTEHAGDDAAALAAAKPLLGTANHPAAVTVLQILMQRGVTEARDALLAFISTP